jgi:hypothetical protein
VRGAIAVDHRRSLPCAVRDAACSAAAHDGT